MKKFLLSAAAIGLLAFTQVSAQCTPGNITAEFQPAIGTTLPAAPVGSPYSTTVLLKAPATLSISASSLPLPPQFAALGLILGGQTIDVTVSTMNVTGISGQPAGLNGTVGGGVGGTFQPNQQGCVEIAGTPTQGGNYTVTIGVEYTVSFDASGFGFGVIDIPTAVPAPEAKTYNLSVPTSVEELDVTAFDLTDNAPNPFSDKTNILFSTPKATNVELTVFNMLGKMVYQHTYQAKAGKNAVEFFADKLTGGLYIYNLSNGAEVRTGKMIVTK
jgi:hypothetical protein